MMRAKSCYRYPIAPVRFYLGTHIPAWLADPSFEGVPLFVSRRRLARETDDIRARTRWALDSGAFTEISMHGRWTVPAKHYAGEARRWSERVGRMDFAATQDWMCEPDMLAKTGKSVIEHQMLTTRSFLELRDLDPEMRWLPILQGWEPQDYWRHMDIYDRAGVDLTREPIVGVGSVCRRQHTDEAEKLMRAFYRLGVELHAFGFKTGGLLRAGKYMASADSMAWSYRARFRPVRLRGCDHPSCQNCPKYALIWRRRLLQLLGNAL